MHFITTQQLNVDTSFFVLIRAGHMLKYNVEIILGQTIYSKSNQRLDFFDISFDEALDYVKNAIKHGPIAEARIIDETGREVRIPKFS